MKEYSVFQAIVMSFYSRKLYRDVANNWGGYAFLYLALILALSWTYFTYVTQTALTAGYATVSQEFVSQIPVLDIKNGIVSTPEKRPYLITAPNSKTIIAIIDTTGKYKELPNDNVAMLVTDSEIITKPKPHETRIDKLSPNFTMTIKPAVINNYIKDYLKYAWLLIFPTVLFASFIYRLLQAMIYSIIGKIYSNIIHANLSYGQVLQISLVSITPVLAVDALISIFHFHPTHPGLLCFVIAMAYLFYGIWSNKQ